MPLGFDLGSSSAKALWFERGRRAAAGRRSFATRRGGRGRVEHDPLEVAAASLAALKGAAQGVAARRDPLPLGIATQRSTVLFWDRDSGRPITPAYSWQDRRAAALCSRIAGRREAGRFAGSNPSDAVARLTGLRLGPHYSASKLGWALRNEPGLRRRLASGKALWGTLGTFLLWRLSRGAVYAIDHANAQRTLLFDLRRLAWEPDLFALFGLEPLLDAPALPALVPTRLSIPIRLGLGGRRFDLRALTGDQQAALIGLHGRRAGDVAINYGSGAFVLVNQGDLPRRPPGLLATLVASWGTEGPEPALSGTLCGARFAVEGPVNSALTALDWVATRLGLRLRTRELDAFLGPDDGRPRVVHFLPAVAGLGAPRWDPSARPRFTGKVAGASPQVLMRAAVESIAMRCTEIVRRALGPGGGPAGRVEFAVRAAGGLTRCRTLLQAQADLLQRPLRVVASPDATALGAALMAAEAGDRSRGRRSAKAEGRAPWERRAGNEDRRDGVLIRPRLDRDEAEARYRAWERSVYRGWSTGRRTGGVS